MNLAAAGLVLASKAEVSALVGASWSGLNTEDVRLDSVSVACAKTTGVLSFTTRMGSAFTNGVALMGTETILGLLLVAKLFSGLFRAVKSTAFCEAVLDLFLALVSALASVVVLPWPHLLGNCFHARDSKLPLSYSLISLLLPLFTTSMVMPSTLVNGLIKPTL